MGGGVSSTYRSQCRPRTEAASGQCRAGTGARVSPSYRNLTAMGWRSWSGRRDSNPRPSAWEADALPLSYSRLVSYSDRELTELRTRGWGCCAMTRRRSQPIEAPADRFVNEELERFTRHLRAENKSDRTIVTYREAVEQLLRDLTDRGCRRRGSVSGAGTSRTTSSRCSSASSPRPRARATAK